MPKISLFLIPKRKKPIFYELQECHKAKTLPLKHPEDVSQEHIEHTLH